MWKPIRVNLPVETEFLVSVPFGPNEQDRSLFLAKLYQINEYDGPEVSLFSTDGYYICHSDDSLFSTIAYMDIPKFGGL